MEESSGGIEASDALGNLRSSVVGGSANRNADEVLNFFCSKVARGFAASLWKISKLVFALLGLDPNGKEIQTPRYISPPPSFYPQLN